MSDVKMITIKEAAEQTNISVHSMELLIKKGELKGEKKEGQFVVDAESLRLLLERIKENE